MSFFKLHILNIKWKSLKYQLFQIICPSISRNNWELSTFKILEIIMLAWILSKQKDTPLLKKKKKKKNPLQVMI